MAGANAISDSTNPAMFLAIYAVPQETASPLVPARLVPDLQRGIAGLRPGVGSSNH